MRDPIWSILREQGRYNLVWLAEKTGYSHSHVKALASGRFPAPKAFRERCTALLGIPERHLFDLPGDHQDAPSVDTAEPTALVAVAP